MVGVDGSETSAVALRRAADEASAHGALLDVVHAWNYLDQQGRPFDPQYGEDKARARTEAFVAETLGETGVEASIRLVNDHAAPALIASGAGAFTLVVGARGLGGFRGMVLGSVSQHLVHHAPCPVLIVR